MKSWYLSKTLWVNLIAVIALLLQSHLGFVLDPEAQAGILAVINVILRAVTNAPLEWSKPDSSGGDSEAGFINLRFLVELFLVCMLALCLAGCATTGTAPAANDSPQILAGKSLLAVKSTIVVAATSVDRLCRIGQLPADKCLEAKAAYDLARPAYDSAVDAYLLLSQGGDPAAFAATLQRVQSLANNLLQFSVPAGVTPAGPAKGGAL